MAWLSVQFSVAPQSGTTRKVFAKAYDGASALTGKIVWLVNLSSTASGLVDGYADAMAKQSTTTLINSYITGKRIELASTPEGWILVNVSRSGTAGMRYVQVCVNGVWAYTSCNFT